MFGPFELAFVLTLELGVFSNALSIMLFNGHSGSNMRSAWNNPRDYSINNMEIA